MTDDRSIEFNYTDEDALLDQLLSRTDDSVLSFLETALEPDVGLAHIFHRYPSRRRRRPRDERRGVSRDRPPQDAIADQHYGAQRP
jgi:hypothetical protein